MRRVGSGNKFSDEAHGRPAGWVVVQYCTCGKLHSVLADLYGMLWTIFSVCSETHIGPNARVAEFAPRNCVLSEWWGGHDYLNAFEIVQQLQQHKLLDSFPAQNLGNKRSLLYILYFFYRAEFCQAYVWCFGSKCPSVNRFYSYIQPYSQLSPVRSHVEATSVSPVLHLFVVYLYVVSRPNDVLACVKCAWHVTRYDATPLPAAGRRLLPRMLQAWILHSHTRYLKQRYQQQRVMPELKCF